MRKLLGASLMLVILVFMNTKAFAFSLDCRFKETQIDGVQSIQLTEEYLFINEAMEIPLEKTIVRCGHFGTQVRFDGQAMGYQVVLKSCSSDAELAGHLIDSVQQTAAEVICN